jgi:MFS family permease
MLVGVSFVIAVGFGIVAPALPTFARSFDVSVTAASIVISAFAFMRLAFAPVSGKLVSALGERPVYIWGITVVGLSTGACAFAAGYWQLLVFRALGGIGSTMFTVSAVALLIRLTPPTLRGRSTSLWSSSFLLGSICGPLFGGALITISLRAPFVVYAVALFVAAAVAWLLLRRSPAIGSAPVAAAPVLTVRQAWGHRAYRAALAANFANGWAVYGVRVSLVPLFVVEVLHRPGSLAGAALSVFAAGTVTVLVFSGRLVDLVGRRGRHRTDDVAGVGIRDRDLLAASGDPLAVDEGTSIRRHLSHSDTPSKRCQRTRGRSSPIGPGQCNGAAQ